MFISIIYAYFTASYIDLPVLFDYINEFIIVNIFLYCVLNYEVFKKIYIYIVLLPIKYFSSRTLIIKIKISY